MEDIRVCFLVFIAYSFIGWLIEIVNVGFIEKKIINRGFLIGPYCPIYGVGAVLLTLWLDTNTNDLFGVFVKAMVICASLEYVTSYLMEKLFGTRWWDYSNNRFNINGRICLETMIPFGIGGCILVYIVSPFIVSIYELLPSTALTIISSILFIIFIIDFIISFKIINNFKKTISNVRRDATEEIAKRVRNELSNKSYLKKRLVKAFPNFNINKTKEK